MLAGGVLVALAALPGMPKMPFLLLGGGAGAAGWSMRQKEAARRQRRRRAKPKPAAAKENLESLLRVEPLAIEVGLGLVGLVEGAQESPLLRRISAIRRQLASDLGYLLPPVRVTDNLVAAQPRIRDFAERRRRSRATNCRRAANWRFPTGAARRRHRGPGRRASRRSA